MDARKRDKASGSRAALIFAISICLGCSSNPEIQPEDVRTEEGKAGQKDWVLSIEGTEEFAVEDLRDALKQDFVRLDERGFRKSDVDDLAFEIDEPGSRVKITATVRSRGKTGVEMEALTAVSVAALTIYDMAKAVERTMCIGDIHLVHKSGGKSGEWQSEPSQTER